jgi:DNA-binding transcriptional ArsR family regulator
MFMVLGDETRLYLITRLCEEGPLSISALTDGTGLTRQAVTKHLRILGYAGLATCGRFGREQRWRVEPRRLREVRQWLGQISAEWDRALGRLKTFVETSD